MPIRDYGSLQNFLRELSATRLDHLCTYYSSQYLFSTTSSIIASIYLPIITLTAFGRYGYFQECLVVNTDALIHGIQIGNLDDKNDKYWPSLDILNDVTYYIIFYYVSILIAFCINHEFSSLSIFG